MSQPIIDKSLLNLFAILISGTGVFAILLKYNVPQLNASFWDGNPFAIKRDIIENVLTWIFIFLTLFGLLVQTYSIICGNVLSERLHSTSFYIKSFIVGAIVMAIVMYSLGALGRNIAKRKWLPLAIESQTELYNLAGEIITNRGFRNNELSRLDSYSQEQREKSFSSNYEKADKHIAQIENLLEIKNASSSREEKYSKLSKYFNKNGS
jgi:hypothetical protein